MFYVKAVHHNEDYVLFAAAHVHVDERVEAGQSPIFDVVLFDDADSPPTHVLPVSPDTEEFRVVYIMTERGKTIDTVHFVPSPEPVVAQGEKKAKH